MGGGADCGCSGARCWSWQVACGGAAVVLVLVLVRCFWWSLVMWYRGVAQLTARGVWLSISLLSAANSLRLLRAALLEVRTLVAPLNSSAWQAPASTAAAAMPPASGGHRVESCHPASVIHVAS